MFTAPSVFGDALLRKEMRRACSGQGNGREACCRGCLLDHFYTTTKLQSYTHSFFFFFLLLSPHFVSFIPCFSHIDSRCQTKQHLARWLWNWRGTFDTGKRHAVEATEFLFWGVIFLCFTRLLPHSIMTKRYELFNCFGSWIQIHLWDVKILFFFIYLHYCRWLLCYFLTKIVS